MKRSTIFALLIVALLLALLVEVNQHHLKLPSSLNFQQLNALAASLNQAQASSTSYEVTGAPSISTDFINQVLADYASPAAGTGQALYDLGVQYGIDPAYALAFFQHESTFGKYGMATVTLSLGNIRCTAAYACYQGFATFSSWQASYEAWYRLIRDLYVNTWHLATVAAIIPKYAPGSDHNTPTAYIAAIEHAVDTWRAGKVSV
jgi:hypothetical protein